MDYDWIQKTILKKSEQKNKKKQKTNIKMPRVNKKRSENPFKLYPTTHQTKRAFNNLWLSWNKVMKQKSKNNNIKSVKIWWKIWSYFVINWDPEKTISAKLTSSKKSTYKNHLCKFWKNTFG